MQKTRLYYIDNLRTLLISLIILMHLAITYGAFGSWYYVEVAKAGDITLAIFGTFNAMVQSFTLGFFFLISGYFTPSSYDRKGAWQFLKGRLLRLGIPLLFYIIFIDPLIIYGKEIIVRGFTGNFWEFLFNYISTYPGIRSGPMWFVMALLIFNIIYLLWRQVDNRKIKELAFPSHKKIILAAVSISIITFIVRIFLPLGWNWQLLNFQLPYFTQYIILFIIGILAYRGNWFEKITEQTGKFWLKGLILFFLLFFSMMGVAFEDISKLFGGFQLPALGFALWEQFFAISIILTLTVLFKKRFNCQTKLYSTLSRSSYTAYILHAPILVYLAFLLKEISLQPLLKFVLVAPLALFLCFFISNFVRKLPLAKRIL